MPGTNVIDAVLPVGSPRDQRSQGGGIRTSESNQELRLSFLSHRRLISPAVGLLLEFCERHQLICQREQMRLAVALEEALVNAVTHGNLEVSSKLRDLDDGSFEAMIAARLQIPEFRRRQVKILAQFSPCEVTFQIEDEGPGFDVDKVPDPRTGRMVVRAHGRGLLLMRAFTDDVAYNDTGNVVTLMKRRDRTGGFEHH